MVDRTFGFGQTFASLGAAHAGAAASGDTLTGHPSTAGGDRMHGTGNATASLTISKNVTIQSNVTGAKNIFNLQFTITSPCIFQDMIIWGPSGNVNAISISSGVNALVTFRRMYIYGAQHAILNNTGADDVLCENVMIFAAHQIAFFQNAATTFTCRYCGTYRCGDTGILSDYRAHNAGGTLTIFNSLSYHPGTEDVGGPGTITGDHNATTETLANSNMPDDAGSTNKYTITATDLAFAWANSPVSASQEPGDWRSVESILASAGSKLENNGVFIAATTDDIDGRTRSATTPNIGPTEGFPGLGVAIAAAPGKATAVIATPGDARLEMAGITPALSDRIGIAIQTTSAAVVSLANAGIFGAIVRNLAASTAFSGRSIAELSGGENLTNGVAHKVVVVAGNSDDVFNASAVEGDVVTGTPVGPPVSLGVAAPTIDFHLDERAPLVKQFTISRTARLPDIEIRVLKKGKAVDLSGASILFSMDDEFGTAKVDAVAGVVEDGPKGKVKYEWAAADVDTLGLFFAQFQITVSGKAYRIPNNTTQRLRVVIGPRVN